MSEAPAVALDDISVTFRNQPAIEGITLQLERGGFLGVIGPNGGGKSVLLKTIIGLLEPSKGIVKVFGQAPKDVRTIIGYVPQHASFDRRFPITVQDVVLMGRLGKTRFWGRYSAEDRCIAHECLEQVMLADLAQRTITGLSGGQVQRMLIARALASKPELLLLDEPTASLDSRAGHGIYELLRELNRTMTIVLVSHDIGIMAAHVQTVACLNRHMHYHSSNEIPRITLEEVYGCSIDLIAHAGMSSKGEKEDA